MKAKKKVAPKKVPTKSSNRRYPNLGKHLFILRKSVGLTQKQVAKALGYGTSQFISNFERGLVRPPLKKLKILVKLYEADVDTLIATILKARRLYLAERFAKRL